ncbi:MAG: hypothetical protein HY232_06550 [Acidobacteria bacterium]|nr:hypothetical protein [Acidobacteriota bacterium]
MKKHLKPVELIHAVEKAALPAAAQLHLKQCLSCREALRDLNSALRILKADKDRSLPGPAFWEGFSDSVSHEIRFRLARRRQVGEPGLVAFHRHALMATAVLFLLSVLLTGNVAREATAPLATEQPIELTGGGGSAILRLGGGREDKPAFGFDAPEAEYYLYTDSRLFEQIHQELSQLTLGPNTSNDFEGGLTHYIDY